MKFSTNAALFLAAASPAFAFTKVDLTVKCKGTNVDKLSVSEKTIIANALESSYNDIHGAAEADDSELFDVHYGTWTASDYLQGGGGYGGGFNCNLCRTNDDTLLDVSSSAGVHKAWETKFVETVLDSTSAALAKVSSCTIKMSPHANYELAADVQDSFSDTRVIIEPRCSGISFGSLSVANNALAGHILEDSFNKVHGDSDTDDVELVDVSWGAYGSFDQDVLQQGGGYGGGVHCNLCGTNDDAVLGVSGNAMKAWQAEFVAGLAASGVKDFDKVKQCSISMKPSPYYEQEPNVDIDVKCSGGPNMNSLSAIQATFVAHSLQESYNTVHGEAADDDSELSDVFFHAPTFALGGSELVQGGGGYGGGFNCNLCRTNDDAVLSVSGKRKKAWENEFVSKLLSSSNTEFQSIKSCDITMKPHAEGELTLAQDVQEEVASVATRVHISVGCKGLNFDKLSLPDDVFVGHVLEDTYNGVHGVLDNDDSELVDVTYMAAGSAGFLQGGGYGGGFNCNLCPTNDDTMLDIGVSGAAKTKWEDEFTLALVESGRRSFKNVKNCSIKMTAEDLSVATAVEEPVKCGLRACAEE